jgi:hypothetical protein
MRVYQRAPPCSSSHPSQDRMIMAMTQVNIHGPLGSRQSHAMVLINGGLGVMGSGMYDRAA